MPELPEVETTKRGLEPHILQQMVDDIIIRQHALRWPVREDLAKLLANQHLLSLERRAKYLLFRFRHGTLITHLGMSGSFRVVTPDTQPQKHDHVDIIFKNNKIIRYNDPRRFGAIIWTDQDPYSHSLLAKLGPEPLDECFCANDLLTQASTRKINIKQLIMDNQVVVGVGNIYACESLFTAGVNPLRAANTLTMPQAERLVKAIKAILQQAIGMGGTTLRDFVNSDGKPGYFKQSLQVYGRADQPCLQCKRPLELTRINNRATVYCNHCQK